MKKIVYLFVILTLTCCSQRSRFIINNADLHGTWTGNGQFLNVNMAKDYGPVLIKIDIRRDSTITGTIGDAEINFVSLKNENGNIELMLKLDGKINEEKSLEKDHLIIIGEIEGNTISANFHLKSNFIFDFSMRVGAVTLIKSEN